MEKPGPGSGPGFSGETRQSVALPQSNMNVSVGENLAIVRLLSLTSAWN